MRMRGGIDANEGFSEVNEGGIDANDDFSEAKSMRMRSVVRWN